MAELTLRVITPDKVALDTVVDSVRLPGIDGQIGVLPRHAPMVAALDVGLLHYKGGGSSEAVEFVSGGFAEVRDNTVRVVTSASEAPSAIDEERARDAEKRARERLDRARAHPTESIDLARAELALKRALIRQQLRRR